MEASFLFVAPDVLQVHLASFLSCHKFATHLAHVLSSKRSCTHLFAGPIGIYALAAVRSAFSRHPSIYATLQRLLQVCGLLWCKVLHREALPRLRALLLQAVCMVECFLPISEMDIKLHELHELISAIENLGEEMCAFLRA